MRVLLDACVPQDFRHATTGHSVTTARYIGLAQLSNGKLLAAIAGTFDVLVTTDKNLRYQQSFRSREVAVIVLNAPGIRLPDLLPLVPKLLMALQSVKPGEVTEVHGA